MIFFMFMTTTKIIAALLICSNIAIAQEAISIRPIITAEVDEDSALVGDEIEYTIRVHAQRDVEIEFPDFPEDPVEISVVDSGVEQRSIFNKRTFIQWYRLTIYEPGEYTIPGLTIRYHNKGAQGWQEADTIPVDIKVESLLGETAEASDIRDIKAPVGFPVRLHLFVITIVLLLLAGAAIWVLRGKRPHIEAISPPVPAHEIAYEALRALKAKDLIRLGKVKEYYFELSLVVRHYLEDRFDLRAPEMTTEEFLIAARGAHVFSGKQKESLGDFLSHCDMVKFAKYGPTEKEMILSFESAERLVDQTRLRADDI